MQPEGAIGPEFDLGWDDSEPAPKGWPFRVWPMTGRYFGNLGHQSDTGRQRLRLTRGPSAQTAFERATGMESPSWLGGGQRLSPIEKTRQLETIIGLEKTLKSLNAWLENNQGAVQVEVMDKSTGGVEAKPKAAILSNRSSRPVQLSRDRSQREVPLEVDFN